MSCDSRSHGSLCSIQHTRALSAIHWLRVASLGLAEGHPIAAAHAAQLKAEQAPEGEPQCRSRPHCPGSGSAPACAGSACWSGSP